MNPTPIEGAKPSSRIWLLGKLVVSFAAGWGVYALMASHAPIVEPQPDEETHVEAKEPDDPHAMAKGTQEPHGEPHPPEPPIVAHDPLEQIDELLQIGDFPKALTRIHAALAEFDDDDEHPDFQYREALTLELMEKHKEAEGVYRELASQHTHSPIKTLGEIGIARCLTRQKKYDESREILAKLISLPNPPHSPSAAMQSEIDLAYTSNEWAAKSSDIYATPFATRGWAIPKFRISLDRLLFLSETHEEAQADLNMPQTKPSFVNHEGQGGKLDPLRRFLVNDPQHPAAEYAQLLTVIEEIPRSTTRESMDKFNRLLQSSPESPVALHAAYNRGLIQFERREFAAARESFLQVVDRSGKGRWAMLGWWWVARSHLDVGEVAEAIKPLQLILQSSPDEDLRGSASLGLAAVYLFQQEPNQAHEILLTHRRVIRRPTCSAMGGFIDARCRYLQAQVLRPHLKAKQEELVEAIVENSEAGFLGPLGVFLVGEAANEVGLGNLMKQYFVPVVEGSRGPLAIRMAYMLGDYESRYGVPGKASQWLAAVAAVDGGEWGMRAKFRLCESSLRENAPKRVLALSREILHQAPDYFERILPLMGQAYELLGDHERAAKCFGGEIPEA